MDVFGTIIAWAYKALATWYVAAIVGGVLTLIAERRDRRREPTEDDVRYAAERYRQYYGNEAFRLIGDAGCVVRAGWPPPRFPQAGIGGPSRELDNG